jgi:hypothetical protein
VQNRRSVLSADTSAYVPIGALRRAGRARLLDAHSVFGESASRAGGACRPVWERLWLETEALPTTRREARRRMFHRLPKRVGAEPMTATKDHPCPGRWRGADSVAALGEGGGRCR